MAKQSKNGKKPSKSAQSGEPPKKKRRSPGTWPKIARHAAQVAASMGATGVTVRQLHYRLVVDPNVDYENTRYCYDQLCEHSAQGRREGWFPPLIDTTRAVEWGGGYASPQDALDQLARHYRRWRDDGQPNLIMLGCEKRGAVEQLRRWFGHLGFPIVSFGGYMSQPLEKEVIDYLDSEERPAVMLYSGDYDPSGVHIPIDFQRKVGSRIEVRRIALTREQNDAAHYEEQFDAEKDSRSQFMLDECGEVKRVELEAMDPTLLRKLYEDAIAPLWDNAAYQAVMQQERADRLRLQEIARNLGP